MPTGVSKAQSIDYDENQSMVRYIDFDRRFHHEKISKIANNPL